MYATLIFNLISSLRGNDSRSRSISDVNNFFAFFRFPRVSWRFSRSLWSFVSHISINNNFLMYEILQQLTCFNYIIMFIIYIMYREEVKLHYLFTTKFHLFIWRWWQSEIDNKMSKILELISGRDYWLLQSHLSLRFMYETHESWIQCPMQYIAYWTTKLTKTLRSCVRSLI